MFSWVLCYLSCCWRYWRTQFVFTSLRTSFSTLFPSLLNIISRRNFLFLPFSKIPKWSAQVDEALNSLFTLANSFIFKTHSFTLRQHLPQMPLYPLETWGTTWGPCEQATPCCLSHKHGQDPPILASPGNQEVSTSRVNPSSLTSKQHVMTASSSPSHSLAATGFTWWKKPSKL